MPGELIVDVGATRFGQTSAAPLGKGYVTQETMMARLTTWLFLLFGLFVVFVQPAWANEADSDAIKIGYLSHIWERPPVLSNLDDHPEDEGHIGALLGIEDNNTTGRFTGQSFELIERIVDPADLLGALRDFEDSGIQFVLLDLQSDVMHELMASEPPENMLLINVSSPDRSLRSQCFDYLLHTALSTDMRTDALAQFFIKKRWSKWFVIAGQRPEDRLYAEAIARSARKFGAKIVEQKDWTGSFDARRAAYAEIPLFTQGVKYDVLWVADEIGDFGDYMLFQTHDPKIVAGTQGLVANGWGRPIEQWGAAQLQERFENLANRWMRPRDYAAWVAVRSIGEAALRVQSGDLQHIQTYLNSEDFQIAGFKGRKMSFRNWSGQMRQPVPVMWERAVVAQPPLEGFLHQYTELDTLGLDRPESLCTR